jgi:threonine synthase
MPLKAEYAAKDLKHQWEKRGGRGMQRWAPLLPVVLPEGYGEDVGDTPILPWPSLGERLGVEVLIKNEAGNPSGSFKDRGLSMGIALGAALGAQGFCLPTQGNAGVAAALFSARLGLPGPWVYMPRGYENSIYYQSCAFFGGQVRFVGENIAAAGRQMRADLRADLESGRLVDISTFFEPGRLEGKKTMGLEIADYMAAGNGIDHLFYPTGGGTGLVGIWKAFQELRTFGLGPSLTTPRLIAVQSEHCAPVVEAFKRGDATVTPVQSKGTLADGLDVPAAIMGHNMLAAMRETGGWASSVSEVEIQAAFRELGSLGVGAGFESAATLAALREHVETGEIAKGSRVLLLLTGSQLIGLQRVHEPVPQA